MILMLLAVAAGVVFVNLTVSDGSDEEKVEWCDTCGHIADHIPGSEACEWGTLPKPMFGWE